MYIFFFPEWIGLEESRLLQFITRIPFEITDENIETLHYFLHLINNQCATGHFGINNKTNALQFKYALTLQKGFDPKWGYLTEIISMHTLFPKLYVDLFKGIEEGKSDDELFDLLPQ